MLVLCILQRKADENNGDWAYRVGVSISAKIPKGSTDSFCRMGSAKAIVFPDPVFAFPIQSLPIS